MCGLATVLTFFLFAQAGLWVFLWIGKLTDSVGAASNATQGSFVMYFLFTLKMASAWVSKMLDHTNSLCQDYFYPNDPSTSSLNKHIFTINSLYWCYCWFIWVVSQFNTQGGGDSGDKQLGMLHWIFQKHP